jgi:hypothetical protein
MVGNVYKKWANTLSSKDSNFKAAEWHALLTALNFHGTRLVSLWWTFNATNYILGHIRKYENWQHQQ